LPILQELIHPIASNISLKVSSNQMKYVNGAIYDGEIEEGKSIRMGYGTLTLEGTTVYSGAWVDDYPDFEEERVNIRLPLR
jgi:hypothetical protein